MCVRGYISVSASISDKRTCRVTYVVTDIELDAHYQIFTIVVVHSEECLACLQGYITRHSCIGFDIPESGLYS